MTRVQVVDPGGTTLDERDFTLGQYMPNVGDIMVLAGGETYVVEHRRFQYGATDYVVLHVRTTKA